MKYIALWVMTAFLAVSCNDWLDVRPETEQSEKDQFATIDGFYDALTGCYMSMAARDIYGEKLTMSDIEMLACLYRADENSGSKLYYNLLQRNYTSDEVRSAVSSIYGGLFYVIAQANLVIKYAKENEDIFTDASLRAVILGEAYALRAYCQLDVLRLFGQLPQGAQELRELPYSFTTSIDEMPAYYAFDSYVELLREDMRKAEDLLKDNDPLFEYTFKVLNQSGKPSNDFLHYRQAHLNYWAVRGIQARLELYLGNGPEACAIAREIINAQGVDGESVMKLSGMEDFAAGYKLCPSECLFYLSKHDVVEYSTKLLVGGAEDARYSSYNQLAVPMERFSILYAGENLSSHNRYLNCWNRNVPDNQAKNHACVSKYWHKDDVKNQTLYYNLIPMLRMSEIYLIAMETSENLAEVNELYQTYMISHNVPDAVNFASLNVAREWIVAEYRREFFAEGQMFYTYKRKGVTDMLWSEAPVTEKDYLLLLPETEFNPNNKK